jgi:uncharacterized protein (DUF3820 family)
MRNQFSFTAEEIKLLRLALDAGALPEEFANAWAFLLRSLRDREVASYEIEAAISGQPIIIETNPRSYLDEIGDTLMYFGKYEGYPLRLIPEDYLRYLLKNHRAGKLKSKIEIWLARK